MRVEGSQDARVLSAASLGASLRAVRTGLVLWAVLLALGACAVAPPQEIDSVQIDASRISLRHSSFSAHAASDSGSISQTFAASLDPQLALLTRLESSFTRQLDASSELLRLGDAVSSVGMWGSSVRFGGMQLASGSQRREDMLVSNELATRGLSILPSAADALFAALDAGHTSLAARSLSFDHSLKGFNGSRLSLTAKDALGRSQSFRAPIIASTRLVEEGCEDFSLGLGKVRRDYAIQSNSYGPLFANTTVACGAPLGFTVEGHGEYLADEVTALGVGLARSVGPLGTASVALASSRTEVGSGWLARVGLDHRNPWFTVALRSRLQSREFREIDSLMADDPVMQQDLASVGIDLFDGASFALAYATRTTWARERADLIAVRQNMSVGAGSLSLSAGHSSAERIGSSLFISYQRPFGSPRSERSPIEEFDLDSLVRPLTLTP